MSSDNWEEQRRAHEERLADDPENGIWWIEYGDCLLEDCASPYEAVRAYEQAEKLMAESDLRVRIGAAYAHTGDYQKGLALLRASLNEDPRPHTWCVLADACLRNNMPREALQAAEAAIKLDADHAEAYYLAGEAVRPDSRKQAAIYYGEALQRDELYQRAWEAMGSALIADDNTLDAGITALCRAVELDPNDGGARIYLANACWRAERYEAANEQYIAAIAAEPENPRYRQAHGRFLIYHGWWLYDQGRKDDARAAFRQAVDHLPDDEGASIALYTLLRETGDNEDAVAEMERYLGKHDSPKYQRILEDFRD